MTSITKCWPRLLTRKYYRLDGTALGNKSPHWICFSLFIYKVCISFTFFNDLGISRILLNCTWNFKKIKLVEMPSIILKACLVVHTPTEYVFCKDFWSFLCPIHFMPSVSTEFKWQKMLQELMFMFKAEQMSFFSKLYRVYIPFVST